MTLEQYLIKWDGKSVAYLEETFYVFKDDKALSSTLIILLEQVALQAGATWLLKHYLHASGAIKEKDVALLFSRLSTIKDWQAKLHLLQCLPYLPISKNDKQAVDSFLRACISADNKFVRAWSYQGFYELALRHCEYRPEVQQLLACALQDEAPSVKARVKQLTKKGF
ncbi:hypothetical protein C3B51_07175 [Pseudoalteromonas rubra]|uniref:HEAT repeat domain-containing protein n=1 Tax=Pseudoalteromonas rubra TaxID=43658 RepID=A0A4Q7EJS1_9GAMM|nr:hypothetical protein [Pseudoalteromonas rubra]RZM83398.1 hypothetical protein C3B51_07175 [Pseudoalteromonas rubra]